MILLTIDEIKLLHSKLMVKTGGLDGVRDFGLLESAVYSANGGFGDEDRYPTIEEKAARLAYAIVSNHAFIDGNKRIGVLVLLMTLKLNLVSSSYSQQDLITLGLSIADGSFSYEDVLTWVKQHTASPLPFQK